MDNHRISPDPAPRGPGERRPTKRRSLWALFERVEFWVLVFTLALLFFGAALWDWNDQKQSKASLSTRTATREPTPAAATPGHQSDLSPATAAPPTRPVMETAAGPTPAPALAWFAEAIDLNPKVGIFTSLVIAPDGSQYAAYFDDANDALKLASYRDKTWTLEGHAGAPAAQDGLYPSLALDPQGSLHLSYFSNSQKQVIYGSRSGDGAWKFEVAVDQVSALEPSLAVTAGQVPHIVYLDEPTGQVQYVVRGSNGWVATTIGEAEAAGYQAPLVVDPQGRLHVVFQAREGGLFYASLQGESWVTEAVDGSPGVGGYPSLAFDRSGRPHISYYDPVRQDLKYAVQDGHQWRPVLVDGAGKVGQFTSLAIDDRGQAHISYYDEGNTALKYAWGQGGQWRQAVVNDEGDVGKYSALILEQNNPRIGYYDESARGLMMASAEATPAAAPQRRLSATHRGGQTFLTWSERSDLKNEIYRIYRSDAPIDRNNLRQATLLAEVGENTSTFWANYHDEDGDWTPRLAETLIVADEGAPVGKGTGVFVWTVSLEDMKGKPQADGYYAITLREDGSRPEQYVDAYRSGPVQETMGDPQPVEITTSPGIRTHAEQGGHYYIQYMDFRRWNPTFHAPNSTNRYYGFDPNDPALKNALAYAYDYSVFEPTPELCGGKLPETLPILVFLHGARGNRYGTPDRYPYPYCAYGVYPIDESETWYFGFARRHDYRAEAAFAPEDVIENYTEQRILRMVDHLLQNPPGPRVDPQRVYLFGHSMGGTGALAFAQRYPNVFAAIYSGQPVTQFFATPGYEEAWPANLATKWGPQALNLPVAIAAPAHWGDPLQKYNGAGVYDWQNLRAAFDPQDPLKRIREDMVPLGIDHGTVDDSVLFPTQGRPLYPLLNASAQAWAGAVTDATHEWSSFGWPLANLGKVDGVPFWKFSVIRDETTPGLSHLSGNQTRLPDAPTTYNQTILWSASWNPWDGEPIDRPGEWQMSFCAAPAGAQACGDGEALQVDITPRRLQSFEVTPGKEYRWENRRVADNGLIASGTLIADANGLLTLRQAQVLPGGNRIRIIAP